MYFVFLCVCVFASVRPARAGQCFPRPRSWGACAPAPAARAGDGCCLCNSSPCTAPDGFDLRYKYILYFVFCRSTCGAAPACILRACKHELLCIFHQKYQIPNTKIAATPVNRTREQRNPTRKLEESLTELFQRLRACVTSIFCICLWYLYFPTSDFEL